jgi:hypothetical protein
MHSAPPRKRDDAPPPRPRAHFTAYSSVTTTRAVLSIDEVLYSP